MCYLLVLAQNRPKMKNEQGKKEFTKIFLQVSSCIKWWVTAFLLHFIRNKTTDDGISFKYCSLGHRKMAEFKFLFCKKNTKNSFITSFKNPLFFNNKNNLLTSWIICDEWTRNMLLLIFSCFMWNCKFLSFNWVYHGTPKWVFWCKKEENVVDKNRKTNKVVLLFDIALRMIETQEFNVIIHFKSYIIKWLHRTKGELLPRSKIVNMTKQVKLKKKLWKLFGERKCRVTKTIALPGDETKTSENLQNERFISVYRNAPVSNMPDTRAQFSNAIFSKLWKL